MAVSDHQSCSPASRAHAVEQLAALSCATSAEMLEVIVAMDRAEDYRSDGATTMAAWLVAIVHVSHDTAREWVRVAHALQDLPCLRARFASGAMSWDQIAPATRFATPDTDTALAVELVGCTAAQIAEMARHHQTRNRQQAARSHRERGLVFRRDHDRDGYRLGGFLPAAEGALVKAVIERRAEAAGPDTETGQWEPLHQRNADALVELCRQDHTIDPGPDPTLVVVHIDADTLDETAPGNGTLDGLQVPLDTVRRLLCDTPIEHQIEGPDGTCIGIGRAQRHPPRWLRRRILHRDHNTCCFPGCNRPIRQLHHINWWHRDHGPTDSWNLAGLCWEHHHLVHEGGWTITGNADHQLTFTSPWGRTLTNRPPPLLPETRQHIIDTTGIDLPPPHPPHEPDP
jgi:hypothetical protein